MKRTLPARLAGIAFWAVVLGWMPSAPGLASAAGANPADQDKAARLLRHYPGIKDVRDNAVFFADGTSLPYDDKKAKDFDERLKSADIEDHFSQAYPAFAPIGAPAPDHDPGRFRNDTLLKKLYGTSQKEVEANLVEVRWMPAHSGKRLLFNKNENAAAQLRKVSEALDKLPSACLKYVKNIEGAYHYRPIAGAKRLSPHSYGIAIDLETRHASYWLWDKKRNYRNQIPKEVVDIFEKHGFIWGGRWHHYDTMHFEYRPEMFEKVW